MLQTLRSGAYVKIYLILAPAMRISHLYTIILYIHIIIYHNIFGANFLTVLSLIMRSDMVTSLHYRSCGGFSN